MADHVPAAVAVEAAPLLIPQGATWSEGWAYCEGDPLGLPAGWPGSWVARMQVRTKRGGDVVLLLHSDDAADGVLTLGSETGVTVTLPDGTTATADVATIQASLTAAATVDKTAFTDKELVFDLELVAGVRVIRLVEGAVILSREVTTSA